MRSGLAAGLIACLLAPAASLPLIAQQAPPSSYSQIPFEQLDQLVAPIALYPDSLVAQVLTASTYPDQVEQAAGFARQNGGQPPATLAQMVNNQPWDPSVKALTAFPSVLGDLAKNTNWTRQLGDAYYNQPQDVMGAVQTMRQRAHEAGTLRSTPQLSVGYQPGYTVIMPVNPAFVYVPVYNPWVVYGAPIPVYPAYVYVAPPLPPSGVAVAIGFGVGVAVGAYGSYGWGYAHWAPNWYSHTVVFNQATYVSRSLTVVNHGVYGGYDHSARAVAYNHQVAYGPNGASSRTAVRTNGQTYVHATGPNGGTASRDTQHYAGGSSTTVTGPGGQTATRTGQNYAGGSSATVTGPNGETASRTSQHGDGTRSTTVTGPNGGTGSRTVTNHGTGNPTITDQGPRGKTRTRTPHR